MMLQNHTQFGKKKIVVRKILSGQTFTNSLNLRCDLDLEHSNKILPQDIPAFDAKYGCKRTSSLEDIVVVFFLKVISWLY